MITESALVRLIGNPADLCPDEWKIAHGRPCRVDRNYVHTCVGDVGHGGKHVCRCGALRYVWL